MAEQSDLHGWAVLAILQAEQLGHVIGYFTMAGGELRAVCCHGDCKLGLTISADRFAPMRGRALAETCPGRGR